MQLHRFLFSVVLLFAAITSVGLLSSCSENEKDTDEFANWKSKNTKYWTDLYNITQQKIAKAKRNEMEQKAIHQKTILLCTS